MISDGVVLRSVSELGYESAMLRGPHCPMVYTHFLSKSSSLPTLHPRRDDRDVIDATSFHRDITTDLFKALSPEQLTAAPNILNIRKPVIVPTRFFKERRPHDPQSRILGEFANEVVKVL